MPRGSSACFTRRIAVTPAVAVETTQELLLHRMRPTPCSESGLPPSAIAASPIASCAAAARAPSSARRGSTFGCRLPSERWPQMAWSSSSVGEDRARSARRARPRPSTGTIDVAARLRERRVDRALGLADAPVDGLRDGLAEGEQRAPSFVLAGQRRDRGREHAVCARAAGRAGRAWCRRSGRRSGRSRRRRGPRSTSDARSTWKSTAACMPRRRSRARGARSCRPHAGARASAASRYSIAATSIPSGVGPRSAARRRSSASASARGLVAAGAQTDEPCAAAGEHPERDAGHDAERAFGADEEIDEVHARGGEVAGGELPAPTACGSDGTSMRRRCRRRAPTISKWPAGLAVTSPRPISSTPPSASTTVERRGPRRGSRRT